MVQVSVETNVSDLLRDITRLESDMARRMMEASETTASRLVSSMRSRLSRQLSPEATGATQDAIAYREAYDKNGYVVVAERQQMPNLPLWLEKGTDPGKRRNYASTPAKPYWYISIEQEAPAHERRILDAYERSVSNGGFV